MKIKKGDFLLFLVPVLLFLVPFLALRGGEGESALISVSGDVIMTIDLTEIRDEIIELDDTFHSTILVRDGRIGFLSAACPDQTCVRTGMIDRAGQISVCVPSRTVIRVTGGVPEIDAVVR